MKKVARLRGMENQNDYIPPPNAVITTTHIEQIPIRTTGRIKKAKIVFDPSDNYLPKAQRLSVGGSSSSSSTALVPYGLPLERERHSLSALTIPTSTSTSAVGALQKNLSPASLTVGKSPSPITTTTKQFEKNFYCNVCGKGEAKRGANAKNKLINCNGCKKRIHRYCLKTEFEELDVLIRNYRCINCRTCHICSEPNSEKSTITCAKCVKTYHYTCHVPSIIKLDEHQNNWKCSACQISTDITNNNSVRQQRKTIENETVKNDAQATAITTTTPTTTIADISTTTTNGDVNGAAAATAHLEKNTTPFIRSSASPTNVTTSTAASTANANATGSTKRKTKPVIINDYDIKATIVNSNDTNYAMLKKRKLETAGSAAANNNGAVVQKFMLYNALEIIDIPTNVKNWTVDEVASFFGKYFPKEANVFKEHEIDGVSLLLMNRDDVVKKLPFKLGPSLRIYNLILKLQKGVNNPTLSWDL